MLYMSMHAEAIVDLVETEHQEVQFRQVQGDFSLLQGKFMLQEGTPEVAFTSLIQSSAPVSVVIQCIVTHHSSLPQLTSHLLTTHHR